MKKIKLGWLSIFVLVLWGILAFLFKGLFNPNLVLFSNDGPYGVMQSAWLGDSLKEGPGTPMWCDNYWLGEPNGDIFMNITYIFFWFCKNPFGAMFLCSSAFIFGACVSELIYQLKVLKNERISTT